MRESTIENNVTRFAMSKGWLAYKFVSPGRAGVPDRIYLRNGHTVFIEFKAPGKKPSKLQQMQIKKIQHQGFEVHVIDNIAEGRQLFVDR